MNLWFLRAIAALFIFGSPLEAKPVDCSHPVSHAFQADDIVQATMLDLVSWLDSLPQLAYSAWNDRVHALERSLEQPKSPVEYISELKQLISLHRLAWIRFRHNPSERAMALMAFRECIRISQDLFPEKEDFRSFWQEQGSSLSHFPTSGLEPLRAVAASFAPLK